MAQRVLSKTRLDDMQDTSDHTAILEKLSARTRPSSSGGSSQLRAIAMWSLLILALLGVGVGYQDNTQAHEDWSKALLVICVDGTIMYLLMKVCKYINEAMEC